MSNNYSKSKRSFLVNAGVVALAILSKSSIAQELLPPSIITKGKQTKGNDDLIDPNSILNKNSNNSDLSDNVSQISPQYAREMQNKFVSALSDLFHNYESVCNRCSGLNADCDSMGLSLSKAKKDKISKLDEYRGGFFCSGCGQTKSEILAKGEQFPHPGQTAIPATPQQIADKEAQLDREINDLSNRFNALNSEKNAKEGEYGELMVQIPLGIDVWVASTAFEIELINQQAANIYVKADNDHFEALKQIESIKSTAPLHPSLAQMDEIIADLRTWSDICTSSAKISNNAIAQRNAAIVSAIQVAEDNNSRLLQTVLSVQNNITDNSRRFYAEGYRQKIISFSSDNYSANILQRGEFFRMGNYSPSQKGKIIPQMQKFTQLMNSTKDNFPKPKVFSPIYQEQESLNNWIKAKRDLAV